MLASVKTRKLLLKAQNVEAHLEFAKSHIHWIVLHSKRVIFTNDTKINGFGLDRRYWYWAQDIDGLTKRILQNEFIHLL